MPYNRVSAMGVERGLVSPEEQFNAQRADAMRRAQMATLMGGGQAAPQSAAPDASPFQQKEPEIIGNTGTPYAPIDQFNRQVKAGMDMQNLQGTQAMDLQKQHGADSLNIVTAQMAPANAEAALHGREYNDKRAQIDALKKQFDALTGANPNVDANGVTHDPELEPGFKPGPANGGYSPAEILQMTQAINSGGQLPDVETKRAQSRLLDFQTRKIDQEIKTGDQSFADAQAERQAQMLDNQGSLNKANEVRQTNGLAKKFNGIENVRADPELMASLNGLRDAAGGYNSWWRRAGPNTGLLGENSRAQQNQLISGRLDMLIGQFTQAAMAKGYDPKQAKLLAINTLQPLMGDTYTTGY